MVKKCDRCHKPTDRNKLQRFCDGQYWFCQECTKEWLDLLRATDENKEERWNSSFLKWKFRG